MTVWWTGNAVPWDLETDGKDPTDARIITSYAGELRCINGRTEAAPGQNWTAKPERPIPTEASDVHGITTEMAEQLGDERATVVREIAETLARTTAGPDGQWGRVPVVGHNVSYDLTVLDRELRRLNLGYLAVDHFADIDVEASSVMVKLDRRAIGAFYVIDTMVLDKAVDPYRPGPKDPVTGEKLGGRNKLGPTAEFYGVPIRGDAHEASADAMAAARITWVIAKRCAMAAEYYAESGKTWAKIDSEVGKEIQALYRDRRRPAEVIDTLGRVASLTLPELHAWQRRMAVEQAASFKQFCAENPDYVKAKQIDIAGICGDWPIRKLTDPSKAETVAAAADGIL